MVIFDFLKNDTMKNRRTNQILAVRLFFSYKGL